MSVLTKIRSPISAQTGLFHCFYDSHPGRRFVRYWSVFWVPDLQNYSSWTWRFHDSVILSNNMRWQGCRKNQWRERNVMQPWWLAQIVEHRFYDLFELCCTCWKVRLLRLVPNSSGGFPKVNHLNQASDLASWLLLPGNSSPTTQGALALNVTQKFTALDRSGSTLKSNQSTQSEIDIFAIILTRSHGRKRGPWKRGWIMTGGHF